MSIKFSTIPPKVLFQGITATSTSFYITDILSFDGLNNVAPSDLGTQHYCCFRNDTGTIIELMEIDPTTISAGPITIVRRGLSFYGDRTTETTALKLDWPANSTTVQLGTDVPQIFQYLKEYIDAAAIAGAVPASISAAGIVVEASLAEILAGTATKVISAVTYKLFAPLDKLIQMFASTTQQGLVEEATAAEIVSKTAVGGSGARLFINPSTLLLTDVQEFNASGTWTKPAGAKYIEVQMVGGGGGGGGANSSTASGGGASGSYATRIFHANQLGSTETITCGAGGTVGLSTAGGNGGTTSFGSWFSAGGGNGGQGAGGNTGGTVGSVSTGMGVFSTVGIAGGTSIGTTGGKGADSIFATGLAGSLIGVNGVAGTKGAGGSGAGGGNTTGGLGGVGTVIVITYF